MEVYFSVHEVTRKKKISFFWLKLEGHALAWLESDAARQSTENEPPMIDWEVFKDMIKA
jgi:hypothetical protein